MRPPRSSPTRATLLPALLALLLHVGLVWVLVRLMFGEGATSPATAPSVRLLLNLPPGGGGQGGVMAMPTPTSRSPLGPRQAQPPAATTVPASPPESVVPDSMGPAKLGPGAGTGAGGGQGSGRGPGSGDGAGAGRMDSMAPPALVPPEPRQEVLPPLDDPRTLRGRSVDVTFWVGANGRVVRVQVSPDFDDSNFQRSFLDAMRRYRFHPARGPDGSAVPGIRTLTITF